MSCSTLTIVQTGIIRLDITLYTHRQTYGQRYTIITSNISWQRSYVNSGVVPVVDCSLSPTKDVRCPNDCRPPPPYTTNKLPADVTTWPILYTPTAAMIQHAISSTRRPAPTTLFHVLGPETCNSLPDELQTSTVSIENICKSHLFDC